MLFQEDRIAGLHDVHRSESFLYTFYVMVIHSQCNTLGTHIRREGELISRYVKYSDQCSVHQRNLVVNPPNSKNDIEGHIAKRRKVYRDPKEGTG